MAKDLIDLTWQHRGFESFAQFTHWRMWIWGIAFSKRKKGLDLLIEPISSQCIVDTILKSSRSVNFCVFGGPKSGKTQTLISLLDRFIECNPGPTHPKPIILTATDDPPLQLQKRCVNALPVGAFSLRTINSFSYSIIKKWCYENKRPFPGVLTGFDQDAILQDILKSFKIDSGSMPSWFNCDSFEFRSFRNELRILIAKMLEHGWSVQDLVRASCKYSSTSNGDSFLFLQLWPLCAQIIDRYFGICKYDPRSKDLLLFSLQNNAADQLKFLHDADESTSLGIAKSFGSAAQLMDVNMQLILAGNILRNDCINQNNGHIIDNAQLIIVDSGQNLSHIAVQFLQSLASFGAQIVIFLDPDSTIAVHQGADPRYILNFPNSKALILKQEYQYENPHIQNTVNKISSSIGVRKYYEYRIAKNQDADSSSNSVPAYAKIYPNINAQYREIVNFILFLNKFKKIPLNKIAIVLRSRANFELIEESLNDAEIVVLRDKIIAADDSSVAAICSMAQAIITKQISAKEILDILSSEIFRCRKAQIGGYLSIIEREIALELGGTGADWKDFCTLFAPLHKKILHAVWELKIRIRCAFDILQTAGYKTSDFLLVLWKGDTVCKDDCKKDFGSLIESERIRLEEGRYANRFGFAYFAVSLRRLDSLYAFFDFAHRFTHTHSLQSVDLFLKIWKIQKRESFPSENRRNAGVVLTTPGGIADRHFDAIILPDLNESTWPNLKIRDRLLGAGFVDFASGVADHDKLMTYGEYTKSSIQNLRNQELQMFLASVSAAKKYILATAVQNDRSFGSLFLKFFTPTDAPLVNAYSLTQLPEALATGGLSRLSSRSFEDYLLAQLMTQDNLLNELAPILKGSQSCANTQIVDALFALAHIRTINGIRGKIPLMRGVSSKNCLIDFNSAHFRLSPQLALSPSSISKFLECSVCWFASQYACPAQSEAQKFGIILHLLAQNLEHCISFDHFIQYAKDILQNIKLHKWRESAFERRIVYAAENLWNLMRAQSFATLGSEIQFSFTFETSDFCKQDRNRNLRITIRGRMDKLCTNKEQDMLYILDIKSGKKRIKVHDLAGVELAAPQLVCYTMALDFAKGQKSTANKELTAILRADSTQNLKDIKSCFVFPESEQKDITAMYGADDNIDLKLYKKIFTKIAILQSGNLNYPCENTENTGAGFAMCSDLHGQSAKRSTKLTPCFVLSTKQITDL